jgi:hypothetical protein
MTFGDAFTHWLDTTLPSSLPDQVKGFSFNLTSIQKDRFAIELIGASRFEDMDPDWACDEVWQPSPRQIQITPGELGNNWTDVLESSKRLVIQYLNTAERGDVLKAADGVAVGFVDGDLEVVWKRK